MKDDRGFWKLLKMGALNGECASLEELSSPFKIEVKGYCTSHKCTTQMVPYTTKRGNTGHKIRRVTERYVTSDKRDVMCPNCGCSVIWRKVK